MVKAYSRWEKEHRSILEGFSSKNVLMLFSGGKDSSLALDFLLRAQKEFGFDFNVHAGTYPVHRYPDIEIKKIASYWKGKGAAIQWHSLNETDEVLGNEVNPCLHCQKLRKEMLKTYLASAVDDWKGLVLVTGYSLWDIVSYSLEHIITDVFSSSTTISNKRRFMETGQRFYPLLTMQEGYSVFRPLIKYESEDILTMITDAGIPTLSTPCQYGEFRPKRVLEKYYRKAGATFDYDKVFDFARKCLDLPDMSTFASIDREKYLLDLF